MNTGPRFVAFQFRRGEGITHAEQPSQTTWRGKHALCKLARRRRWRAQGASPRYVVFGWRVGLKRISDLVQALENLAEVVELFHIGGEMWGVSIPTRLVDLEGEASIRKMLQGLNVYDLYSGTWTYA